MSSQAHAARQYHQKQMQAAALANVNLHDHREEDEEEEERGSEVEEKEPRCPVEEAVERGFFWGWASYLTFYWAGPFLTLGASRTLTEKDLLGIGKEQKR